MRIYLVLLMVFSSVIFGKNIYYQEMIDGQEAHGGGAFVCRDSKGNIKSAHLLDLFEAKALFGWKVNLSDDSVDNQIERALEKLQKASHPEITKILCKSVSDALRHIVRFVQSTAQTVPEGVGIAPPKDTNHQLIMENCSLEGAIAWNERQNRIYINERIVNKLSNTDQAALFVHEAIYKLLRDTGRVDDSQRARKVTGSAFADIALQPVIPPTSAKGTEICRTQNGMISFLRNQRGSQIFRYHIIALRGEPAFSEMYQDLHQPSPFHNVGMSLLVESKTQLATDQTPYFNVEGKTDGIMNFALIGFYTGYFKPHQYLLHISLPKQSNSETFTCEPFQD